MDDIFLANAHAVEELYASYCANPESVDPSWRYFFEGMRQGMELSSGQESLEPSASSQDLRIHCLIQSYRTFGHLMASFDPLATTQPPATPKELELATLGFKAEELHQAFPTCGLLNKETALLSEIIEVLKKTYCDTVGFEYMGLGNPEMERWIQQRIEPHFLASLDREEKLWIMHDLNKAELFELFLHTKYTGQKRFSLEGGETLIPLLATLLEVGADESLKEVVLGMAHRGRLNVLTNLLNKSYAQVFYGFEDHFSAELDEGIGDVKYHRGFSGLYTTRKGKQIPLVLTPNPSHLESVNPVVVGAVRAKQELLGDALQKKQVAPILIHGDAAISGQGIVYETMQLSRLTGYGTGGTVHVVINNQIGFTTLPKDERSTRYCTDIGLAFGAPVFHVNAEDPEKCVLVAKLAMQLRQAFQCDVFIDLNCYRKLGHNEGDEPAFTQPLEYRLIREKQSVRMLYQARLMQEGVLDAKQAEALETEFKGNLQHALDSVFKPTPDTKQDTKQDTPPTHKETDVPRQIPPTGAQELKALAQAFCRIPEGLHVHPKLERLIAERLQMLEADPKQPTIDWGMAEHLAYATIVAHQVHVRLSGQDCRRGTFSHRHAMIVDQKDAGKYFPLSHVGSPAGLEQGLFDVFNSCLSELAVLGFEYGYSLFYPNSLVIWEAQYGDFANGAQIMIDQYIATSKQKWAQSSNLTLMLPHGYEGSGPEHSSARIERFLQLAGEDNIWIVNCTKSAQLFHALRRQAFQSQKPLILFTPKMYLRHVYYMSSLVDLTEGSFQEVLDDPSFQGQSIRRVLICSGKVVYDLLAERDKRKAHDVAIVCLQQLYPFPEERLHEVFVKYKGFTECVWVQEEHSNMGAWEFVRPYLNGMLGNVVVKYAGRMRSASPAVGSYTVHKKQLAGLLEEAFT